jgi:hypothetical protein
MPHPRANRVANGVLDAKICQDRKLQAAIKVLAEAKEPMNCMAMVEAMQAKGYWTSPAGKTPHQTLNASILREIAKKGKEARFVKADCGMFALASQK